YMTSATEHKCVTESARWIQSQGADVTYLDVDEFGKVNMDQLEEDLATHPDTALVSIMTANNEMGTLNPMDEIGALCKKYSAPLHTDAAQACGKIPVDVKEMGAAMLSLSGHKMYGPKGVGALYVSRKPRTRLRPIISGGGQERGLRSGTLAVPLVVGLGAAAAIAEAEMEQDMAHNEV
ncbi:hypothetical protein KIPB_012017, partial [Kipferlia bialata]